MNDRIEHLRKRALDLSQQLSEVNALYKASYAHEDLMAKLDGLRVFVDSRLTLITNELKALEESEQGIYLNIKITELEGKIRGK